MIPFRPSQKKKRKKPDFAKVTELVYATAGRLPKGCGAVYAFPAPGETVDRSRAHEPHDCLTLARPIDDNDGSALQCPLCARLIDPEEATRLRKLRQQKQKTALPSEAS